MSLFERSLAPKINLEPEKFSRNGIDVSKWQGDIDWKAVKDDGIDFAMIRLGLGSKNGSGFRLDPYFEKNVGGALDAGINIGCYFYSYALTIEEAREEAQYVVDVLSSVSDQVFDHRQKKPVGSCGRCCPRQFGWWMAHAYRG